MTRLIHLAIVAWPALAVPLAAQDLVLTNARILDPVSRTELQGSIWIQDGRVLGTGPQPPAGVAGQRIDLGGRRVIPGLVDLHTHSFGNADRPSWRN